VRREPIANDAYEHLADQLTDRGGEIETVKAALKAQRIETPSWGYGDSGTRFKVFAWPGVARDVYEKLADAAFIHRLTGIAPSVGAAHPLGPGKRLGRAEAIRCRTGSADRRHQPQPVPGRGVQIWLGLQRRPRGPAAVGLNPDPIAAYHASDYPARVAEERGRGKGGAGGYPEA